MKACKQTRRSYKLTSNLHVKMKVFWQNNQKYFTSWIGRFEQRFSDPKFVNLTFENLAFCPKYKLTFKNMRRAFAQSKLCKTCASKILIKYKIQKQTYNTKITNATILQLLVNLYFTKMIIWKSFIVNVFFIKSRSNR